MRHFTWERPDEQRDYAAIVAAAMTSSKPTEIGVAEYEYALNVMPPIYVTGGFLICEAMTDGPTGPVHSMYAQRNGRYYSKYVVKGQPHTYIDKLQIGDAYDLDVEEAKRYEEDDD